MEEKEKKEVTIEKLHDEIIKLSEQVFFLSLNLTCLLEILSQKGLITAEEVQFTLDQIHNRMEHDIKRLM
jgi:predicted HTH transcriptional regulator